MSKKEELIKKLSKRIFTFDPVIRGEQTQPGTLGKESAEQIYDEIRASILTPKVVSLLKAIEKRPDFCSVCK